MKTLHFRLWDALLKMRETAGLRQEELAILVDISRNSVVNYEKGRTRPKWSTVERWADACDYRLDPTLRDMWETWVPAPEEELERAVTTRRYPAPGQDELPFPPKVIDLRDCVTGRATVTGFGLGPKAAA